MKNKILKGITYFMIAVFLIAGCGLDDQSWLPNIICSVCLAWLVLFLVANRKRVLNEII